ncbi:MAG: hypothetical protein WCS43_02055 [Verrucomicrobiota bacterium]
MPRPLLIGALAFVVTLCILMLPWEVSAERILPGNGWTHATHQFGCWEKAGRFGPDYRWIRIEFGLFRHWMVHDKAFFGTQEFFRCDILEIVLDLIIATVIAFAFAGVAAVIIRIRDSSRDNQLAEQAMGGNRR